jgi:hypothetical protein
MYYIYSDAYQPGKTCKALQPISIGQFSEIFSLLETRGGGAPSPSRHNIFVHGATDAILKYIQGSQHPPSLIQVKGSILYTSPWPIIYKLYSRKTAFFLPTPMREGTDSSGEKAQGLIHEPELFPIFATMQLSGGENKQFNAPPTVNLKGW